MDVIGAEGHQDKYGFKIPVGDVYANENREITIELDVPAGTGSLGAVKGWIGRGDNAHALGSGFSSVLRFTRDMQSMEKDRDLDVQARVDVARSTKKVEEAMKALDEGRKEEAKRMLTTARDMVTASPAASAAGPAANAVEEQAARLDEYSKTLEKEDDQRAKKAIQYENYRVQKKKK